MVGYEQKRAELEALGARIVGGSVDPEDKAAEAAADVSFPVAYGMTRADADAMGAFWGDQRGGIFHATEFILDADGNVMSGTYSNGPIGRVHPEDAVRYLTTREQRRKEAEGG